jgi:hypothetical protein
MEYLLDLDYVNPNQEIPNPSEAGQKIADADPLHAVGARTYEILPWLLNDGALNIRVTLSRSMRQAS